MGVVVLLLSESRTIINDLNAILHGFMIQIIYSTVFRVKWLNRGINITSHFQGDNNMRINGSFQKACIY